MLDLIVPQVADEFSRENFKRIQDEFVKNPLIHGEWKLLGLIFLKAETNLRVEHGLKFLPKDIIITSKTGAGSLTVNYDKTSITHLDLTTSDACVVRLLLGSLG